MNAASEPENPCDWPKRMDFVHPAAEEIAKQDIPALFGINAGTTSSRGISMLLTMFEPGGNSNCHMHVDSESALYVVQGSAHFFFGEHLEHDQVVNAGDFIYVPPYVPHQEINASDDEPLECVLVRSGGEAVVVNLDIAGVERPTTVAWVDSIHKEG